MVTSPRNAIELLIKRFDPEYWFAPYASFFPFFFFKSTLCSQINFGKIGFFSNWRKEKIELSFELMDQWEKISSENKSDTSNSDE